MCGNSNGAPIWRQWWVLAGLLAASAAVPRQPQPPNVVFIMVDDMGWNDVSFHGSDQILTPNIDSLAYHGVILHQYYSEAVCTPARTALLTGKYPMRLGMHGMPLFNSEDRGIPLTERLLPSYLRELGYATHLVGKWHVGMSRPAYLPTARGYDTHYGMRGGYIDYYTYNKVEQWPNGRVLFGLDLYDGAEPQDRETRYIVDALTDNAIKVISRHNTSRPLFLHVTHNAPHAGNDGAALQPPLAAAGVKNPHIANSNRRLYADVVTQIDRSVGRIVRALADRDLLDDTIIVFASDNGAPTVGSLRNWGVNLPLRGKKNTPWEGGVRVPAFIWHAGLRPRVWSGLMHVTDWLPTLTAAAGGSISRPIDGVNQWDSIVQDGLSKRTEVLLSVEDSARNMYAAYRAGDYKVIVGNVTGLSNGYYGAELLAERRAPPEYFPSLRSCAVARAFEEMGRYLQTGAVTAARRAATVAPADSPDPTACLPTPNRGCLFNVRRDPTETRDLWARAPKIAALLTARLRGLWAQQARRGPPALRNESDPALYGYNWRPWITDTPQSASPPRFETLDLSVRLATNRTSTRAVPVDCSATTGIRNFLCILKSVF